MFRIKNLNVKASRYQKQWPEGMHHSFFRSTNRKTSRMQRTLSTRKNWFAHINLMNGIKPQAVVRMCSVKIHRKTPEACNFIKKETLVQVFSCEFSEILSNT